VRGRSGEEYAEEGEERATEHGGEGGQSTQDTGRVGVASTPDHATVQRAVVCSSCSGGMGRPNSDTR